MLNNIHLRTNNGNNDYNLRILESNPHFLSFLHWLRSPRNDLEETITADISPSDYFTGQDECELKKDERSVSFLLSDPNLKQDLEYFKKRYLSKLNKFSISRNRYKIKEINLINQKKDLYELTIESEKMQEFKSAQEYWQKLVEPMFQTEPMDVLSLWIGLNSLYRQIPQENRANDSIKGYLTVMQRNLSNIGAGHLSYDRTDVATKARYEVPEGIFRVSDSGLSGKNIRAYSFTPDLETSVFFEPSVHQAMLNQLNTNIIRFRVNAKVLLDIK